MTESRPSNPISKLSGLQQYLEETQKRMIILFEGRDASGKGGTIRRVTRYMNEKHYRNVIGKPTANNVPSGIFSVMLNNYHMVVRWFYSIVVGITALWFSQY